jgi:hypothetical protein
MGRRRPRAAQPALVAHCPQSCAANALETLPITSSLVERQMSILAGAFESRGGDLIGELLCECCSLQSMSERQTLTGDQRAERAKSSNPGKVLALQRLPNLLSLGETRTKTAFQQSRVVLSGFLEFVKLP